MGWHIWATAGMILILVELFTPTFFTVFLGAGALVTALFVYLDIADSMSVQIIFFSVFSGLSVLLFRNLARKLFGSKTKGNYTEYTKDRAVVEERIEPSKEGKVLYRGTIWIAYSDENRVFEKGEGVVIAEVNGIKLKVESS